MIIKAKLSILSIGYPGAMQEDEIEVPDEELEDLSEEEKEKIIEETLEEWANQHIEYWYE